MASNQSSQQQYPIGQQLNRPGGNYPPGMVMQNQAPGQQVQMIGNQNSNVIMYNQEAQSNSRRDVNQRIF